MAEMNGKKLEKILKAIATIADSFEDVGSRAPELRALVSEITEVGEVEHLTSRNNLLARIVRAENKLTITPVESLQIKADDPALRNFLYPRVLDKMKEKHGISYTIGKQGDFLRTIEIQGGLDAKLIEEIKSPALWALDKAASRS